MGTNRAEAGAGVEDADLSGRTALVTGSTDGIGREVALALGRLGATVIVHGRDEEKGRAVAADLRETAADGAEFRPADFASLDAVRELAAGIAADHDRLDVLVNNAGGFFSEGRLSDDGIEYTFAVNHFAPFLLTAELLPLLRAGEGPTGEPRVVVVASEAHRSGEIDFEGFRTAEDYNAWSAYAGSKLANVLFARELARRVDGVTANACHPGLVFASGFRRNMSLPVRLGMGLFARLSRILPGSYLDTAVDAAETPVYLAAAPDLENSGAYFEDREPSDPAPAAEDDETARRLWEVSAEITGVEPELPADD